MDTSAIKQYDDERLKIRILVVDDEIDVIYIMKRILEEMDYFKLILLLTLQWHYLFSDLIDMTLSF